MKKFILLLCLMLTTTITFAYANCLIIKKNSMLITQQGNYNERHSPFSTFKIIIALMGFNENILSTENNITSLSKEDYNDLDMGKKLYVPINGWMKNNTKWNAQIVTNALGYKKFEDYINKFGYGNRDINSNKTRINGWDSCWLASSLEISPLEQLSLLEKLNNNKLPVNIKAQQLTRQILYIGHLTNGWHLYGKTGAGFIKKSNKQIGWFIGWAEKDNNKVIFVNLLEDKKRDMWLAKKAKEEVKEKLLKILK